MISERREIFDFKDDSDGSSDVVPREDLDHPRLRFPDHPIRNDTGRLDEKGHKKKVKHPQKGQGLLFSILKLGREGEETQKQD